MLDENKVKLMTKIAIFEKNEKYDGLVMSKFFQSDYVRFNVLKTWVAATFLFWSVIGCYCLFEFEEILLKINDIDYFAVMYKLLGFYAIFCLIYFIAASVIYNIRYYKKKKSLVEYNVNLKELISLEGGMPTKGKVVETKESIFEAVAEEFAEKEEKLSEKVTKTNSSRVRTGASAMVQKKLEEEEEQKRQQIIENARRLEQKKKAKEAEQQRLAKQTEMERRRIQERRKQLEREQMERIRAEQSQRYVRENHTYNDPNAQYMNNQNYYGQDAQYANNQNYYGQDAQYANNQNYNGQYVSNTNINRKGSDR